MAQYHAQHRRWIFSIVVIVLALALVTPALADYLGPNRTVTETVSVCKIILNECQFVEAKNEWKYKQEGSWSCSLESKPWQAYPSNARVCNDLNHTAGYQYWERDESTQPVTNTYPPATINASLLNCTQSGNWCSTLPQLSLSGSEPVSTHYIMAIEGFLNGQNFACMNSSCSVPMIQGRNDFAYWAVSSFGDTSTMGMLTANVDTLAPNISGTVTGTAGTNGWYLSPASLNVSISDATSGVATIACTLDGVQLGSCNVIAVNSDGPHALVVAARDHAGHLQTITRNVSVDTQNPSLSASISGTLGSNDWYTAAALNASASDASPGSGLSVFEYSVDNSHWTPFPSSGTLPLTDGSHVVDLRASDKAGRSVFSSRPFSLDTLPPGITLSPSGTLGLNEWYIANLTVNATASDDTSGVDVFEYRLDNSSWAGYTIPLTLTEGIHEISFWAQDKAGLVTQVDDTFQVDTRPPQIAGSLSGTPGTNGWYTTDATVSASASDPTPGSGIDTFTYTLNTGAESSFIDPIVLSDGQHIVQLKAYDRAGLSYSLEQNIKVDTIQPALKLDTALPNWVKNNLTLNGTAGDDGSGLSEVEISLDGGQTWQVVTGTTNWDYIWETTGSASGAYQVAIRASDLAGLTTQQTFNIGVDNHSPQISLPTSWFQWDTVTLDIWDSHSGLSQARVEISDPENRWPKRVIQLDPNQFPLNFKWDRRFDDGTVAEPGTYDLKVFATDNLGHTAEKEASIKILLDILPPGPTATPQTYTRPTATNTPLPLFTSTSLPVPTQTAMVSVFGNIEPTVQVTPTPVMQPTPRATPTQMGVLDLFESFFVPDTNEETVTEFGLSETWQSSGRSQGTDTTPVLWGVAATAAIGAATAYAQEQKRKREEEEARKTLLEEQKEERRKKMKERKIKKMEEKRAQEEAWEAARLEAANIRAVEVKVGRIDEAEAAAWAAAQAAIRQRHEERKKREEEKKKAEELKAGLAAYYSAMRQGEAIAATPPEENTWWENTVDWIDDHQTEIALSFGVAAGVAAIVLSGGLATPLVAAAWMAGAAVVAGVTAAAGTVALNAHYDRPLTTNLAANVAVAGITAAVVSGVGFLFNAAALKVTTYCTANMATCGLVTPVFKLADTVEETYLKVKLAVETWSGDQSGAAETALELHSEHLDGGMPGNSVVKELHEQFTDLSTNAIPLITKYGSDVIPLLFKHGDEALEIIQKYGEDGVALIQKYGDDAITLVNSYGQPAIELLGAVDPWAAQELLQSLDDDVLDYAIQQGPDAVEALSRWSAEDLRLYGPELALRAKKDAEVLADVQSLVASGAIDPKHLTQEQQALINAIAANSTQYADEGQVVLGKWVDFGSGFVETAQDTGSVHYNPHPDMWNLLGDLGGTNQGEVAWLINQQVVKSGIDEGLPFEYTLNGIPAEKVLDEVTAVEAIFAGATDTEIKDILGLEYMPIRMKELQELQISGYELTFDEVNNSYVLVK